MTFRMERLWMMQVIGMTLSFSAILLSGCTSSAYLRDRSRDAGDIFTATCGVGFGGVKARVGPVGTGLFQRQWAGQGGFDFPVLLRCLAQLDADVPLMLEHLPNEAEYRAAADHIRNVAQQEGITL